MDKVVDTAFFRQYYDSLYREKGGLNGKQDRFIFFRILSVSDGVEYVNYFHVSI